MIKGSKQSRKGISEEEFLYNRFIEKIIINPVTGCWEWQASLNNKGYGYFRIGGRMCLSHRFSYEYHVEKLNGAFALHKCDNPKCCNPGHLFPGTYLDNHQDMDRKKRRLVPRKLLPSQVVEIKKLIASESLSSREIAEMFNVTKGAIDGIRFKGNWAHITI